ncbi:MAG: AAA domain-containing protein [Bacilli bacterium]
MQLIDLKTNKNYTFDNISCKIINKPKDLKFNNKEGRLKINSSQKLELLLKDAVIVLEIEDTQQEKLIKEIMKNNYVNLVNIESSYDDILFIKIVFFYREVDLYKIDIVLNDDIMKKLKRGLRRDKLYFEDVKSNFTLKDGIGFEYIAFSTNKYEKSKHHNNEPKEYNDELTNDIDEIKEDSEELSNNNNETKEKDNELLNKNIILYGKKYNLLIGYDERQEYLEVKKIIYSKNNIPCMQLGKAVIEFSKQETFISSKVRKILENNAGYLEIWKQYSNKEGEFLLKDVREVGVFKYKKDRIIIDKNNIILQLNDNLDKASKYLEEGKTISITKEIPQYISNPNLTWKDYLKSEKNTDSILAKVIKCSKNGQLEIECESKITDYTYISMSILGDQKQIERREKARNLIEEANTPNPQLSLVISGNIDDYIPNGSIIKKKEALSSFVREKIFKNPPTQIQKEAIEIALNTPDIAIIQGPPGTGKTTVITAIIERLNEMSNKNKLEPGEVLITSFQHDAVRNVIERLSINSLPTIKFGKQNDSDESSEELIEKWTQEVVKNLQEKNPKFEENEKIKELNKLYTNYKRTLNSQQALNFLNYAKSKNIDNAINELINFAIEEESSLNNDEANDLVIKIRRLRITKNGFLDDGSQRSEELLSFLERTTNINNLDKDLLKILEKTSYIENDEITDEDLKQLRYTKIRLLDLSIKKPMYVLPKLNKNIEKIYMSLKEDFKNEFSEVENIIYELYNELKENKMASKEAISSYNYVYASTTQQSQGREIREKKGIKNRFENPVYSTVIVDEAARVNPGDLMVPLSQAKQRIILVGDHRQLPHIYNEEIIEELSETKEIENVESVKETLFEYFMQNAKKLQQKDNIPRNITLDAQYRMHPMLGQFVSDNFYKAYGEEFRSPLDESYFKQEIYKKPLNWVVMNDEYEKSIKDGRSRSRLCEAEYIANSIKEHILSDKGKNLTYGVISFYSSQVKLIRQELKKALGEKKAREVRVGSVDAFQGMEFDVMYLSIVRSESKDNLPQKYKEKENHAKEDYEQIGVGAYGFLTSENRLCVALSRQKKVLVVVGNSDIFVSNEWSDIAKNCISPMQNLYALCKEKGEIINVR